MTARGNLWQLNSRAKKKKKKYFMEKSEKEKTLKEHLEIALNVLFYFYEQIKNIEDDNGINSCGGSSSGGGNNEPRKQEKAKRG